MIETIIWDWNGTLLDDIDICIESINRLLLRRNLPEMEIERYRRIFTFPVKDYYKAAGFDFEKEAFEIPAGEYMLEYYSLLKNASLFEDAVSTLELFKTMGIKQYIVSAMEQKALLRSVEYLGINSYFEQISGINDNLAFSKLGCGKQLINQHSINPAKALFIGDTLHDYEVGKELGLKVILTSRGHQCCSRFKANNIVTVENLSSLPGLLFSGKTLALETD